MRNTSELALHLKELISSFRGYIILSEIGLYQPLHVLMSGDLREKMYELLRFFSQILQDEAFELTRVREYLFSIKRS